MICRQWQETWFVRLSTTATVRAAARFCWTSNGAVLDSFAQIQSKHRAKQPLIRREWPDFDL
jgi:hypothetical protein